MIASQKGRYITPVSAHTYAPVVGSIAAGEEREAIERADERRWVDPDYLEPHPDCFYLRVSGDSMDKIVKDGDCALIGPVTDAKNELAPDEIAAVIVNGDDATLKRVKFTEEGVFLKPDSTNPKHKMRFLAADNPDAPYFKVLGRFLTFLPASRGRW